MTALGAFSSGDVLTAADMNAIGTWTTFTPAWTNLTVGNGTQVASYCQINELVAVQFRITLGSTSSVGSGPSFDLPVNSSGYALFQSVGTVTYYDSGGSIYAGFLADNGSNRVLMRVYQTSGTYASSSGAGATVPFTWGTGDQIMGSFTYRAA